MLKRSKGRDTLARLSLFQVVSALLEPTVEPNGLPYTEVLRHKDEPPATCP